MIHTMAVKTFLNELAAKTSTPGGGSAAALSGAMGSALVSMVAQFTIGKKDYAAAEVEQQENLQRAELLREQLLAMINADIRVFNQVMDAYGLPKTTAAEKAQRTEAIQSALKEATDVPLACAKLCGEVIDLSEIAAISGNKNVISDAGVAVLAAHAGLKSAALNVYINIAGIKDTAFNEDRRAQIETLVNEKTAQTDRVYALVKDKL